MKHDAGRRKRSEVSPDSCWHFRFGPMKHVVVEPKNAAVAQAPQRSILSRMIGTERADQVEFGRRWQSEVYDLGAVLIDEAEVGVAARCVFRCDLIPGPDSSLVCSRGGRHTFVLVKNEYITSLCIRRSTEAIVSLKIYTNLRSSQWFGGHGQLFDSNRYEVEELAAPRGYYVSNLYGSHMPLRCNQLGCRFDLLSRPSRIDPIRVTPSEQQTTTAPVKTRDAGANGKSFFYSHSTLQAVAIICDVRLRAVSIVTDEQYARYLRDRESALGPNEHLLELIADEQIRRIDVCHSSSEIVGLRFMTTLRITQWFGSSESGTVTSLVNPKRAPTSYVCGLFGTRDVDGICSLGAVYQVRPEPRDGAKDLARWDALRDQLLPVTFPTLKL
jgi:hypothetical protein